MSQEIWESMLAAARAGEIWFFWGSMLLLIATMVWVDVKREKVKSGQTTRN